MEKVIGALYEMHMDKRFDKFMEKYREDKEALFQGYQKLKAQLSAEQAAKAFAELNKTGELSDEELDNVSGGCGSGDEPLFAVGQWVYVRATNAAALILENLGKQGSVFPEFKYKIEVNDTGHFIVEKWESELKKSYRGDD